MCCTKKSVPLCEPPSCPFFWDSAALMKVYSIQCMLPSCSPLSLPYSASLLNSSSHSPHSSWPLSPVHIQFPAYQHFHTDGHLLQESCLSQAPSPLTLGQFFTTLFTPPTSHCKLLLETRWQACPSSPLLYPLPPLASFLTQLTLHGASQTGNLVSLGSEIIPNMTGGEEGCTDSFWLE